MGLAKQLYQSTRKKLDGLSNTLEIYPSHGSGSFCGGGIASRPFSTLGQERLTNPFLKPNITEKEFVDELELLFNDCQRDNNVTSKFIRLLIKTKHSCYETEQEYRIITQLDNTKPEDKDKRYIRKSVNNELIEYCRLKLIPEFVSSFIIGYNNHSRYCRLSDL